MQLGRIALLAIGVQQAGCASLPDPAPTPQPAPESIVPVETPNPRSSHEVAAPSDSTPVEDARPTAPSPLDSRTPETIRDAIVANRASVRRCYEEALKTNPGIAGDLVVQFVIRPSGALKTAEVQWAESDIHVPELETCTLEAVQAIQFPRSSRGMESTIHYPYNFQPGR